MGRSVETLPGFAGDRAARGTAAAPWRRVSGRAAGSVGRLGSQAGWTLAELMVVTGVLLTLAGIAVPQYSVLSGRMRAQAASARVLSDVNFARLMSLRTGVPHYVQVTGAPDILYQVQRSGNPPAIAPATDPVLRSVDLRSRMPGVRFALNGVTDGPYGGTIEAAAPDQLIFGARGLPLIPASFFLAQESGGAAYAISVTGAGRTRLWRRSDGAWK